MDDVNYVYTSLCLIYPVVQLHRGVRAPACSSVAPLATLGDLAERPDTWTSLATIYSIKVRRGVIVIWPSFTIAYYD